MRIHDFLHPWLEGVTRVVESHAGSLNLTPYFQLPEGIAHERRTPGESPSDAGGTGEGVLWIGVLGPDAPRHGPEVDARALVRQLEPGGRCAILFGYPAAT